MKTVRLFVLVCAADLFACKAPEQNKSSAQLREVDEVTPKLSTGLPVLQFDGITIYAEDSSPEVLAAQKAVADVLQAYTGKFNQYLNKKNFFIFNGVDEPYTNGFSGSKRDLPIQITSKAGKPAGDGTYGQGFLPGQLLMLLAHEESHWSSRIDESHWTEAIDYFEKKYPNLAKESKMGNNPKKAYVHVIVNWYELQAGKHFLGNEVAYNIAKTIPYYRPIYDTVLRDEAEITKYMVDHKYNIESEN